MKFLKYFNHCFQPIDGNQRTEYIQPMTMNDQKVVRVKETAIMSEIYDSCGYTWN